MKTPIKVSNAPVGQVVSNRYSSCTPFSQGNAWLLLQHPEGFFGLYRRLGQTCVFIKLLPAIVSHSSEPIWSKNEDDFYFLLGNCLYKFNIGSFTYWQVRRFKEYAVISGKGESDLSADGDHLVLAGDGAHIFVYEISTDTVGPVLTSAPDLDGLKITQSNEVIASYPSGIYRYGKETSHPVPYDAHCAVAGNALIYAQSDSRNAITKVGEDGVVTTLLDLGWAPKPEESPAVGLSTCSRPFFLASTYGKDKTVMLSNKILKIPTDGGAFVMLCESPTILRDYTSQPKAALSRDGSLAVFNVDDGNTVDVWLVRVDDGVVMEPPPIPVIPAPPHILDYSSYVGNTHWIMWPQSDGSLKIEEVKEKV